MNKTKRVVFTSVAVTIATVGMLNIADSIYAGTPVSADTSGLTMSATIEPSSTVTIGADAVNLDIVPSTSGTFKSNYVAVSAYTNTTNTCNVTMTTSSSALTSGANSIPSLTSAVSESDFSVNRWGYRAGSSGDYNPVATGEAANPVATLTSMTGGSAITTNVYFAAKLNQAIKPGTYSNTVTFASTCPPPTISTLTYMQDFATLSSADKTSVLNSMTTSTQYQLKDSRDQKEYYISKLADGNVWMTQNLDHNIVTTAGYYTPQNTDIPSAWTPSTATYATGTTTWATGTTGNTTPQSYDPGDLCWDGTINEDWDGTLDNETTTCGSDKHMSIGNYYNWTAAIAMSDSSSYTTRNTDVGQSICPAGWRLPFGGTTNTGSKSFQYLWDHYSSSFDETTMMNPPLYFSYAGRWGGSSFGVGSFGSYWSSEVYDSSSTYDLDFEFDFQVFLQAYYDRNYGVPIRCVAR